MYIKEEKGMECPVGNYCPAGSSKATKCPAGTYRNKRKGKSEADCFKCPTGTFNKETGATSCKVCGTGATSTDNRRSCQCIGRFRTWKESTLTCACQKNYLEPNATTASATTTILQDCVPLLNPQCQEGTHRDDTTN